MIPPATAARAAWRTGFAGLTGASLAQPVVEGGRTPGFIAWPIVTTISEMMGQAGIAVEGPSQEAAPPASAAELAARYSAAAEKLAGAVKANWSGVQLAGGVPRCGGTWKKGFVLGALIAHQTHHRGQMTVLMRQAGLKAPGVYGPAREEWAAFGMPAML